VLYRKQTKKPTATDSEAPKKKSRAAKWEHWLSVIWWYNGNHENEIRASMDPHVVRSSFCLKSDIDSSRYSMVMFEWMHLLHVCVRAGSFSIVVRFPRLA
jgi:hypothetical protein